VPTPIEALLDQLRDGQHLVLRSTVYPGVTAMVEKLLAEGWARRRRVVLPRAHRRGQGHRGAAHAPQIVSARTERAVARAERCSARSHQFDRRLEPEEAELAKLFTNTWRYIKFAAANQLFMIANDFGLDFARIRAALKQDYPRARTCPGPGSPPARACSRTRCSSRRSTTTTSPSATQHARSTRACRCTCVARSSASTTSPT
jgi:UDP-N-acetyl-D-mannosaminuronic acid dehydrogenase